MVWTYAEKTYITEKPAYPTRAQPLEHSGEREDSSDSDSNVVDGDNRPILWEIY